jgi:hypothetical protein
MKLEFSDSQVRRDFNQPRKDFSSLKCRQFAQQRGIINRDIQRPSHQAFGPGMGGNLVAGCLSPRRAQVVISLRTRETPERDQLRDGGGEGLRFWRGHGNSYAKAAQGERRQRWHDRNQPSLASGMIT